MTSQISVASALAFAITLLFVPLVMHACKRWQLFDCPGALKIHSRPIPRLGGVAIVLAIVLSSFVVSPRAALRIWSFFAALLVVWIASLIDDVRSVSAVARLAAQVSAGVILWFGGWHAAWLGMPNHPALNATVTCLIVIAFVNSTNFWDGADGLAAGVSALIAAAYGVTFPSLHEGGSAVIASCVAASCAAFLFWNWPPARCFMGDCGSAALGLSLGFLALSFWRSAPITPPRMIFPLLVAALPLLDAALAIARRLLAARSPLYGDRAHIYDLLRAQGIRPANVALICYGVTALFVAIGLAGLRSNSRNFWSAASAAFFALLVLAVRLASLQSEDRCEGEKGNSASKEETKRLAATGGRAV